MNKIEISNFGPIRNGDIEISPFTVLIGPNGSGKSYTAMMLHSFYGNSGDFNLFVKRIFNRIRHGDTISDKQQQVYDEATQTLKQGNAFRIDKSDISPLWEFVHEEISTKLDDRISSIFSSEKEDLVTIGRRKCRFDVYNNYGKTEISFWSTDDEIQTKKYPDLPDELILLPEGTELSDHDIDVDKNTATIFDIPTDMFNALRLDTMIAALVTENIGIDIEHDSYYLPAARSGLLESHNVLSAGAFEMMSNAGFEPIEVPAFSGEIAEFLKRIDNISDSTEGELSALADTFENNLLDGTIILEEKDERTSPAIKYKQAGNEIPLHQLSTGVSETASLILYTRYLLSEGSTLVIEEPEAHLHPENQLKIAHFLIKLSNAGVRVVVTTHSDFFLQQLSNSIVMSQIDDEIKADSDINDVPSIDPEDVSVHLFEKEDIGPGDIQEYTISKLATNKNEGVSLKEFERVTDNLYNTSFKIDRLLEKTWEENE